METVSGYSQPLLHHQTKVAGYRIPIKTFAYSLYCSTTYRLRRLQFSLLLNFAIKRRQHLYILSRIKILPFSSIQTHGQMTPFVVGVSKSVEFDLSSTVVCKEQNALCIRTSILYLSIGRLSRLLFLRQTLSSSVSLPKYHRTTLLFPTCTGTLCHALQDTVSNNKPLCIFKRGHYWLLVMLMHHTKLYQEHCKKVTLAA